MITSSTTDLALVYRVLGAKGSVTDKKRDGWEDHKRKRAYKAICISRHTASSKQLQELQTYS
jgi:hypothetical protein